MDTAKKRQSPWERIKKDLAEAQSEVDRLGTENEKLAKANRILSDRLAAMSQEAVEQAERIKVLYGEREQYRARAEQPWYQRLLG